MWKESPARFPLPGEQSANRPHELFGLVLWVGRAAVAPREAVADVPVQQSEAHLVERRPGCVDLCDHVDAVAIVLDHPCHASDLALDPSQPVQELVLRRRVSARLRRHVSSCSPILESLLTYSTPWGYRYQVGNERTSGTSSETKVTAEASPPGSRE